MKKATILVNLLLAVSLFFMASVVSAEEYEALKGLKSAKAIFDVRIGDSKRRAAHGVDTPDL